MQVACCMSALSEGWAIESGFLARFLDGHGAFFYPDRNRFYIFKSPGQGVAEPNEPNETDPKRPESGNPRFVDTYPAKRRPK